MKHAENASDEEILSMDDLVRTLLGFDPKALRMLGSGDLTENDVVMGSSCREGFNILLRRVLTLYLALFPNENAVIRLETESSALAAGWPDARTANTALLLTWGLFGEDRKSQGLPVVPLLTPDANVASLDQHRPPATLEPASTLVRRVLAPLKISGQKMKQGEALWANPAQTTNSVDSTNRLIQDLLGLDPLLLARGVRWFRNEPAAFFEQDADRKGWTGLHKLLRDALMQYVIMEDRRTEEVRLMSEHDAQDAGRPDARSANAATLLSAGLMSEGGWEIMFFQARPYSQEREDLLKAMALEVMRSKSMLARRGFELLCEDMVHHGVYDVLRKSSRLLDAAHAELKSRGGAG